MQQQQQPPSLTARFAQMEALRREARRPSMSSTVSAQQEMDTRVLPTRKPVSRSSAATGPSNERRRPLKPAPASIVNHRRGPLTRSASREELRRPAQQAHNNKPVSVKHSTKPAATKTTTTTASTKGKGNIFSRLGKLPLAARLGNKAGATPSDALIRLRLGPQGIQKRQK